MHRYLVAIKYIMGNYIKKSGKKFNSKSNVRKLNVDSTVIVGHKAKVLTSADVEANRSRAYTYLSL